MTARAPRRTHVVTGAGSGIGAAVAERLQARGDHLVLLARDEARVDDLAATYPGADVVALDLADPAAVEAWRPDGLDVLDGVDSLLHVAGFVELGPVATTDRAVWERTLHVNVTAPALLTRTLLPALRARRGTVVFVNSGAGLTAHPQWGAYAASKFALRAVADALRGEEGPHGVRVSTVFPGRTATPMQAQVHAQEGADYDPGAWIAAGTVADAIIGCVDLPRDATLAEVVVRPGP
ncbi:short-subunit dehydrogenase [Nocardioides zeae]|uniref:Short-subunit dehydrogenase n=1 Tax=Nocardioides zeae TaxID=1457234 RepID=A0ACC6IGW6_9ACTN|nr:SDR family oxidoreductase [Nocardioides zeae]MDR6172972.1 short-subunit dehydrogenase [Nocardioides zeae]MDR6209966.1 short-subunit dehydrogenase [Nocardioides zeae]